jgi:hypothetical protein
VPPGPAPIITQRVRAILLADDNGQRRVSISPAQVKLWVDKAREVHAAARIGLQFDPAPGSGDWELMNSTLLNTMTGTSHPLWNQQRTLANQTAAQTPERMVVFFRWGPESTPTGGGFSWTDYNFIAMPGFAVTTVCGEQNIGLFAHEMGHYLGLPHTFPADFNTIQDAENYFISQGNDPEVFNADGRDDTVGDPFVWAIQCQPAALSIELNGTWIPLPRTNAMSYYHPISTVTNAQAWTMRQTLLLRSQQGLTQIVRGGAVSVKEGEAEEPTLTGGSSIFQTMDPLHGIWSGGTQLFWIDAGLGGELTTSFRAPDAGEYDLYASFTAAPDYGIHRHFINGQAVDPIDLYASIVLVTGPVHLGRFHLLGGDNEWKAVVSGSDPRAIPRHGYGLDYILVARVSTTDVGDPPRSTATLMPGRPNPFSDRVTIEYRLERREEVRLRIHDLAGRLVTTLATGVQEAGPHTLTWSGIDEAGSLLPSGVYLCSLSVGSEVRTQRVALVH